MTIHTIAENNIENHFLNAIAQKGITEGNITEEFNYSNSKTIFLKMKKENKQ